MRVVLQRVSHARVSVDGAVVGEIGPGMLLLVGVGRDDPDEQVAKLADKVATLRVFADAEGKTNLALADVEGAALVVSQFTVYGDVRKGRRPSWTPAEDPERAAAMVEAFAAALESRGVPVARGSFGADMQVELTNDGPFTLILDADEMFGPSAS
jgi:D-tyrosyl-tRNA(Tyr) deacylase